jgi:hypothetical protein
MGMDEYRRAFFALLGLLVAIFAAAAVLPGGGESRSWVSSPHNEVERFAKEGRARLSSVRLVGVRDSRQVIGKLCQLAAFLQRTEGGTASKNSRVSNTEAIRSRFLEVLEVPVGYRGKINLEFETSDPMVRKSATEAAQFLSRVVAPEWLPKRTIHVHAVPDGETRAHASNGMLHAVIFLYPGVLDIGTAAHELAHHIEFEHPEVLEAARGFLWRRAKGGHSYRLRDITGLPYEGDEFAFPSDWAKRGGNAYSGKVYGSSIRSATATELVSMASERMLSDPMEFLTSDADYFLFFVLVLQSVH